MSIPLFIAVIVGIKPILPDTATNIKSLSLLEQISSNYKYLAPCIPFEFVEYAYLGLYFAICSFSKSILFPAAREIISKLSGSLLITSRACLPIEPVEPSMLIFFFTKNTF